jgi:hypothetical protein
VPTLLAGKRLEPARGRTAPADGAGISQTALRTPIARADNLEKNEC